MAGGSILGGSSSAGNKQSSTNTTTNQYDQRVVNDASNGGRVNGAGAATADGGSSLTNVNGSNNNITDGGAFQIVARLADQLANVSTLQTTVARDIALRDTPAGTAYANAALKAQEAALAEAGVAPEFNKKTAAALAVTALVGFYIWKKK